ncbi:MAG: T9SS type A sorting domain-containing protein, partial [Flavobacteriales bacterium]
DDVKVVEQPANDLVTEYAFISHNGTGDEYGRIPQSQLRPEFSLGGGFYNFGYTDQNNCIARIDVVDAAAATVMSATNSFAVALVDSTYEMEEVVTPVGPLSTGLYEGTLTVVSDEEPMSTLTFPNNIRHRNFMVTEDRYSIDGIGVHPEGTENLTSIGTESFADAADGFMMFTLYDVSEEVAIMGLEILLSSSTVPGGTIICSIHDTIDVNADDVNLQLEQTDVIDITQEHVDAGMITVLFDEPFVAEPNAYFAGVEMFSNDNASEIRIVDDLTVVQPTGSSLIYTPDDQTVYANGNAAGIRLITADNVGIANTPRLTGVNVYPNPTEGLINVRFTNAGSYNLEVVDVLGASVYSAVAQYSTTIDLTEFAKGVYTVKVSNQLGVFAERLIVQ